jgi:hypothetical protein
LCYFFFFIHSLTLLIILLQETDKIVLDGVSFNDDGKPKFKYSLTIEENLEIKIFSQDFLVPATKVSHITQSGKIERLSDISNILAFLNNFSDMPADSIDVINHCVLKLTKLLEDSQNIDEVKAKKISFLVEQLRLANQRTHTRRYSTSFLWAAIGWLKTSPVLYKFMSEDGFLTLPSCSYLKQLSGAFSLESGLSSSSMAYLAERIKNLSEQEKIVALAIDEVT